VVIIVVGEPAVFGGEATAGCHISFATDDRFDARIFSFAIELDRPEHVAMVGYRYRRLAEGLDLLNERLNLICAVQETELGMQMQMDEGSSHCGILGGQGRRSQTHKGYSISHLL